jgi:hypothetical protein
MSEGLPQNYANHVRRDPIFHFFLLPVLALTLVGAIAHAVRRPEIHSFWWVILVVAVNVLAFRCRQYALKVQDRVIRLEERLRLMTVLPDPMLARIGDLTESQLIGLRFASDAELPELVSRTLEEKLSSDQIKKAVKQWRPDEWRV